MQSFDELSKNTVPVLWRQRSGIFGDGALDCRGLAVDSAGVAFLVKWSQSLGDRPLRLLNPGDDLTRLITLFRLEKLFVMENKNG